MNQISVWVQHMYLQDDGTYSITAAYKPTHDNFIETDMSCDDFRRDFEERPVGCSAYPFIFPCDDYIALDDGYQLDQHGKQPFYYAYPSDDVDVEGATFRVMYPEVIWGHNNASITFRIWARKADDTLVKYGTLKSMFGTYKQHSDAALDAKLAELPAGVPDAEAVDAAIDAKLAAYTTERDAAVRVAVDAAKAAMQSALDARMAEVRQAVEGVLLYENAAGDSTVYEASLGTIDVSRYARIEVHMVNHHRTGIVMYQCEGSVSFDMSSINTASTSFKILDRVHLFLDNINKGNTFLFSSVFFWWDNRSGENAVEIYCNDDFVLDCTDGTPSIVQKPSDATWTYISRIVGYPKLPGVA